MHLKKKKKEGFSNTFDMRSDRLRVVGTQFVGYISFEKLNVIKKEKTVGQTTNGINVAKPSSPSIGQFALILKLTERTIELGERKFAMSCARKTRHHARVSRIFFLKLN